MTLVKVCGLTTSEAVDAAVEAGADYFGLMLFSRSPRAVTVDDAGRLIERAGGRIRTVAVLVDPDDALADAVAALSPDLIQLHGRETPERMAAVRARTGLPVIKALPVGAPEDVAAAGPYTADHFMFDAKPPAGADRLGGHGAVFDWSILSSRPSLARDDGASDALWFLAGGLTPDNVAEAIRITGAPAVDVSSGVESAPGVKDPALIAAFVRAAKAATP